MMPPKDLAGPARSLEQTPEFQAAVDAAVAAALPAMLAQLAVAREALGSKATPDDPGFAKALALEIAKISGQGTGRTYVDPVILEQRERATIRLRDLLIELRAASEVPAYRLIGQTQLPMGAFGPVLIDPKYRDRSKIVRDTEIDWPGIPNLVMRPINPAAERVFALFAESIGHVEVAEQEDELGPYAVNATGAVMRGEAARSILRNDPAHRHAAGAEMAAAGGETVAIRRGEDPVKRKVRVLGTLMEPIEVS